MLSRSAAETEAIGETLGKLVVPPFVVALFGDLGSGKTTFVRGFAKGLGVPIEAVRSPSFTLVNQYEGRVKLYHIDLYRLDDISELIPLGFTDIMSEEDAVCVIEWAERGYLVLPDERLDIYFDHTDSENERWITFHPQGETAKAMIEAIL